MNRLIIILMGLVAMFLISCAAHHSLVPLEKGDWTGNISLGGPVVSAFDTRVPIPYLTAGVTYGWQEKINISGNLHLMPLFYQIAGCDFGVTWFPVKQNTWIPTIGFQPRLMLLASLKTEVPERFRLYPILTPTAAWKMKDGFFYTGMNWILPLNKPDYNKDAPPFLISPFCGYRWTLKPNLFLYTEIKWQGANLPSDKLAADYWPIAGHGAFTTLISIERGF